MRSFFAHIHERNSFNGQEVRQQEHDTLPKMRPKNTHSSGKDLRKLRVWLFKEDAKLRVAEDEEEERSFEIR